MMQHFNEWIPETVKALRGDMTLKELATKSGLSVSYLNDIERGRTIPTIETLDKIFTACGVTLTLGFANNGELKSEWVYVRKKTLRNIVDMIQDIDPK